MASPVPRLNAERRKEVAKVLRSAKTFFDEAMKEAFGPEESEHPFRNMLREGFEEALVFRSKLALSQALEIPQRFLGVLGIETDSDDDEADEAD